MRAAIFATATGRINRIIQAPIGNINLNVGEGEDWIEVGPEVNDETHYVDAFQLTQITERPSPYHTFDFELHEWVDARSLEEVKEMQWEKIKESRTTAIEAGFMSQGKPYQSDPESKSDILGACQLAQVVGSSFTINWTCKDNTVITMSQMQMIQVGIDLGVHINTQHAIARGLRTAINGATSKEEVEAITWEDYVSGM
jgi:hypothetical protein